MQRRLITLTAPGDTDDRGMGAGLRGSQCRPCASRPTLLTHPAKTRARSAFIHSTCPLRPLLTMASNVSNPYQAPACYDPASPDVARDSRNNQCLESRDQDRGVKIDVINRARRTIYTLYDTPRRGRAIRATRRCGMYVWGPGGDVRMKTGG